MKQLYKRGGVILFSLLLLASFVAVGCKNNDDDEPTKYSVTVATDIANGTLSVSTTSAEAGTTIRLTATPDDGYELESYTVTDSVGNTITVTGGTFTMPESNVTVSATFKEIPPTTYTVTVSSSIANGTVSASPTTAEAGATVTLTATPASGYELEAYSVTDASGNAVTLTNSTFTMPESNVTVSATFKETEESENQTAADAVIAKINAIGTVAYTDASKALIEAARTAYDALTAAQKALISEETLAILTTAESTYSTLKTEADTATANQTAADAVIAKITAIGTVAYTDASKALIEAARTAYDALTAAQKALISEETLAILTTAESTYSTLKTEADTATANQTAADAVIAKINAIGTVAYTDACKALIDDARNAYDALTEAQQELVTNYDTLTEAESTYESLITYTVTLTGGANATASGGATTQSDLSGAMTAVTYTANDGYYFADFTATTTNGITLTRTSSSVVTVSGTPTTDTSITVPDAAPIVPVTGITLNKTSTTISAGSTETLSVSAYEPGNATFQTVTWSSDNTAVATVDASTGLVTAVAAGANGSNASATITATATDGSGITATCTVTVTPASVDVDNRGFTASSWEYGIGGNLITE